MDIKIWIALVTSVASIIVAIISIVNTQINAKNSALAAVEFEKIKFELEQKRQLLDGKKEERKELFLALNKLVKDIQIVKDVLITIINCPPNSYDWDTALHQILAAKNSYVTAYEECCSLLDKDSNDYAHKAKNLILNLEFIFKSFIKNDNVFILLNTEQKDELNALKETLSDLQNTLRDSKLYNIDLW